MAYNPAEYAQPSQYQFNPYNPAPAAAPSWNPVWNKDMALAPGIHQQLDANQLDMRGLNQFRDLAMREGPSDWAQRATEQQKALAASARDSGAQSVAGQTATARSNLAMHGGMGGGAAERIAKSGTNNYLDMSQRTGADMNRNVMQIGMNDEQNKMQQLSMLPGMDLQTSQYGLDKIKLGGQMDQFDVGAQMGNNAAYNKYNMDQYGTQMGAFGAKQTADATRNNTSGGSSFICTALRAHGLMSKRETALMTKLMLSSIWTRADFFAWYFKHGAKAIERAENGRFPWAQVKDYYVGDLLKFDFNDPAQLVEAQNMYAKRAGEFIRLFAGEEPKESFSKPGRWKSWLALPAVFLLPGTWRWMWSYFAPKISKKCEKLTLAGRTI